MEKPLRILFVEDSEMDADLVARHLKRNGLSFEWRRVETPEGMRQALADAPWDAILSDYSMPAFGGPEALGLLNDSGLDIPFILISGSVGEERVATMLKSGAQDFILKENLTRLAPAVEREIRDAKIRREHSAGRRRIDQQRARLSALRAIDMAITGSLDLRVTLGVILGHVVSELGVHAAAVLLLNEPMGQLEYSHGTGFRTDASRKIALRLGQGYAGRAALEKKTISVPDLRAGTGRFVHSHQIGEEGFVAYYAVPLEAKGRVKGVLELFHRGPMAPDEEWMSFLEALAGQTAIAIDNAAMFIDLERSNRELVVTYDATLEGWIAALDLRDKETEGHSARVTLMTVKLAQIAGIAGQALVHARRGALLHDVGKLGIPDSILLKPGKLTPEEWEIMRKHPVYAHEWLSRIPYLIPAIDIPYCHHEKWDGSGYPRGLKGETIPLAARLFALIDVWDALRSDRPYRSGWPQEKVLDHIMSEAGRHFDPRLVELFLTMIAEEQDIPPLPVKK